MPIHLDRPTSAGETIDEIPTTDRYERATVERGFFGAWLRRVKLKEASRIYLWNQSMV